MQEVFVALWIAADRFDPGRGSEPAFVATLAHRRLTDYQRRVTSRRRYEQAAGREAPVAGIDIDAMQCAENSVRMIRRLEDLPEEEGRAVWMSAYQGMTQSQISEATGAPLGTHDRFIELLSDERLGVLTPEDRAELERLVADGADPAEFDRALGELLVELDAADPEMGQPPSDLRDRLIMHGRAVVAPASVAGTLPPPARKGVWGWAAAAAVLLAGSIAVTMLVSTQRRSAQQLDQSRATIASLEARISENRAILASAERRIGEMRTRLDASGQAVTQADRALADAAARELALGRKLAEATSNLNDARLTIARYEQPQDPAELKANREQLLEVPDTIRIAWAPFDLPDKPAEQGDVTGDVVWNDELETGYLRFVGLKVNDPSVEQYQVWVIDDRGMEQKVSGGVFNATAQGEVIVPIRPGIDVRQVALFAITIEEPGGTWVPDLARRVVVAPR
eukprot:g5833.t1